FVGGLAALLPGAEGPPDARRWEVDLGAPDPLSRWRVIGGGAKVEGGVLSIDGIAHRDSAVFPDRPGGGPSAIRVRVRVADDGPGARGFGVLFASRSTVEFLYLHFDRYRQVILVRSDLESPWDEIARQGGIDYSTGRWHRAEALFD